MSIDFSLRLISSWDTGQNVNGLGLLTKMLFNFNDTQVSTMLLDSSIYINNSIFKTDRGSNICKVTVKNLTYLIDVNNSFAVLSKDNAISIFSILISHEGGNGFPETCILFSAEKYFLSYCFHSDTTKFRWRLFSCQYCFPYLWNLVRAIFLLYIAFCRRAFI